MNILSTSERKALNSYLGKLYNEEFNLTNWMSLCLQWNHFNPAHKIENIKSRVQPDYTTINDQNKIHL